VECLPFYFRCVVERTKKKVLKAKVSPKDPFIFPVLLKKCESAASAVPEGGSMSMSWASGDTYGTEQSRGRVPIYLPLGYLPRQTSPIYKHEQTLP
jgi:hypothetical protein